MLLPLLPIPTVFSRPFRTRGGGFAGGVKRGEDGLQAGFSGVIGGGLLDEGRVAQVVEFAVTRELETRVPAAQCGKPSRSFGRFGSSLACSASSNFWSSASFPDSVLARSICSNGSAARW